MIKIKDNTPQSLPSLGKVFLARYHIQGNDKMINNSIRTV